MAKKLNLEWLYAASMRAIRTMAQMALTMFTVGSAFYQINWLSILSVSAVAGIYSMLTSIVTDLPETVTDGTLQINTSDPTKDTYLLQLDSSLESLSTKKTVSLVVKNVTETSQK